MSKYCELNVDDRVVAAYARQQPNIPGLQLLPDPPKMLSRWTGSDWELPPETPEEQEQTTMQNIVSTLEAGNATNAQVQKAVAWLLKQRFK